MMRKSMWGTRACVPLFAGLLAGAVAGGCVEGEPGDQAPTIQALRLEPEQVVVGEPIEVFGTLLFEDEDRDIVTIKSFVKTPGGDFSPTAEGELNTTAREAGTAELLLDMTPPSPGTYRIHVLVVDSRGNESNVLVGTVEAVIPGQQ